MPVQLTGLIFLNGANGVNRFRRLRLGNTQVADYFADAVASGADRGPVTTAL